MLKRFQSRSEYFKNISKLVAGTTIAQIISFLVAPVITRLYTPSEVGAFTFLISIAGGIALVATLRYEMAIILPKDKGDSVNIAFLSLLIAFGIAVLTLAVLLFSDWFNISGFTRNPVMQRWIYLLPLLVFLMAAGNVFQHWFNHNREYRTLATSKIITSAGNNLTTVLMGFAGFGALGLWLGNFAGFLIVILFFAILFFLRYRDTVGHLEFSTQKRLAHTYQYLPLTNMPQVIVDMVQVYGIIFLLQTLYSSEVLGWYSLSQRLLQAPMFLIGTSICQVFYKDASEKYIMDGDITGLLRKTIKMSAIVALPVLVVMLTIGPWLIALIFGLSWKESGIISRILAPWFFFDFIRSSVSYTPLIIGKTRQMFYITMIGAILMVIAITAGGLLIGNSHISFILLSVLLSIYCVSVIWWIFNSVNKAAQTFSPVKG